MHVLLKVILGKQKGQLLRFPHGEFVFGRGAECDVRPDSPLVSRQHCLLSVRRSGAWLRDLGSRNGTLVNGVSISEEKSLRHGDQVQVGPLVLEVLLDDAPSHAIDETGALSSTIAS